MSMLVTAQKRLDGRAITLSITDSGTDFGSIAGEICRFRFFSQSKMSDISLIKRSEFSRAIATILKYLRIDLAGGAVVE